MNDELVHLVGAVLATCIFVLLFVQFKLVAKAQRMSATAMSALSAMGDVSLSDLEKEKQIQRAAIGLLGQLILILGCSFLAIGVPVLLVWGAEKGGWLRLDQVLGVTMSWWFLVSTTVLGTGIWWLSKRGYRKTHDESVEGFEVKYSTVEKLVHQMAFATRDIQVLVARLEDKLFLRSGATLNDSAVFVAALPRAGTTLLMEVCFETGKFATHTYRDMPFVLTPYFWRKFARWFKSSDVPRQRAHGDGMMVSVDSPEAFEEILWMSFWEEQYQKTQITPWPADRSPVFDTFFSNHRHKLISMAADEAGGSVRYLSKNNLNIARIELLLDGLPNCRILIPFRHPSRHCSSLLRQHLNFLSVHEGDAFAKAYMGGVGHFDFGENLRPVNFGEWLDNTPYQDTHHISFWCAYWVATYQFLLGIESDRVRFVDFDALCERPKTELKKIADFISLDDAQLLLRQASKFTVANKPDDVFSDLSDELIAQIDATYQALSQRVYSQA